MKSIKNSGDRDMTW